MAVLRTEEVKAAEVPIIAFVLFYRRTAELPGGASEGGSWQLERYEKRLGGQTEGRHDQLLPPATEESMLSLPIEACWKEKRRKKETLLAIATAALTPTAENLPFCFLG